MKKGATSIRFSDAQNAILKEISEACGVGEVDAARWAVEALGDYWRHHGNRLLLPLKFHETFTIQTLPVEGKRTLVLHERVNPKTSARPVRPQKSLR